MVGSICSIICLAWWLEYVKYDDDDCMISMCCDTSDVKALMCLHVIDHECV